jgi:hypothetical protein
MLQNELFGEFKKVFMRKKDAISLLWTVAQIISREEAKKLGIKDSLKFDLLEKIILLELKWPCFKA